MTPKLVSLIISLLALVIVLLQVGWGAIRGLKKSTFRLVWVFAFGVLCLLVSNLVAKSLVGMDISFLNINVDGEVISTLPLFVQKTLESSNPNLASVIVDNPEIIQLCTTIATMFLSLIVFEILFWLTKWLLWPIWAILSAIFIKKKKVVSTEQKKLPNGTILPSSTQTIKFKKHAGYGALVGLALGIIVCIFTFVPVVGISKALAKIDSATAIQQEDGTSIGLVSKSLGNNAQYLNVYSDSAICKIFTYTGIDMLDGAISSGLTTTTYENEMISLSQEINNFAPLYVDYQNLTKIDFSNLSKESLNTTLNIVKDISDRALSSKIVASLYKQLVPYFVDNILNTPNYFITLPDLQDEILNKSMKTALASLKEISIGDLKQDALSVIDMAKEINDVDLLKNMVNGSITLEEAKSKLDITLGQKLNEKLFNMKTLNILLPNVINTGVEYLCKKLNVEFTANQITSVNENLKTMFGKLFTNAIEIVDGIDTNSKIYVSADSFDNIGDIVDSIKNSNIISQTTWNNLFSYGTTYLKDELAKTLTDENLKFAVDKIIDSTKQIASFKNELTYLGNAYKKYQTFANTEGLTIGISEYAKIADEILPSFVYQHNIKENNSDSSAIFTKLVAYIKNYVATSNLPFDATDIDSVVLSIKNVSSFDTEYSKISDLTNFVQNIINGENGTENLLKKENLEILGQKLDATISSGSVLFNSSNCKKILSGFVEKITLPQSVASITIDGKPIKTAIKNNIQNITSYKTELGFVGSLLEIKDDSTLSFIGKKLDGVKSSALLGTLVNPIVKNYIASEADKMTDVDLKNIVNSMKNNVDNVESFATEFAFLEKVLNINFDTATLDSIGLTFDQIKSSILIGSSLKDVICYGIDKKTTDYASDADLKPIIDKIKQNVKSLQIESYQIEFGYLNNFVGKDFDNMQIQDFGTMLDSLVPSVFMKQTLNDILTIAFNRATTDLVDDTDLTKMLTDMKNNIQNIDSAKIDSSKDLSGNSTLYTTEITYLNNFVNYINANKNTLIDTLKDYLTDNLIDSSTGNSKSIIIANNSLFDMIQISIAKLSFDKIADMATLKSEIKNSVDNSEQNDKKIIDVISQLQGLNSDYSSLSNVPTIDITTKKEDIVAMGTNINTIKQYTLILSLKAVNIIGKSVVDTFNSNIQSNAQITADKKQALSDRVSAIDYAVEIDYATLFGNFATDLGIN